MGSWGYWIFSHDHPEVKFTIRYHFWDYTIPVWVELSRTFNDHEDRHPIPRL